MNPKSEDAPAGAVPMLFILWGAFVCSCILYAFLVLGPLLEEVAEKGPMKIPGSLFSLLGAGLIVAGITTGFVLKPSEKSSPREFAAVLTRRLIVQSAFFEAVAIIGLSGFLLGLGRTQSFLIIIVGFIALAGLLPGLLGNVEAFRRMRYRYLEYHRE